MPATKSNSAAVHAPARVLLPGTNRSARFIEAIAEDPAQINGLDDKRTDEEKLMEAAYCLAQIGVQVENGNLLISSGHSYNAQYYLERLGSLCLGWAEGKNGFIPMHNFVLAERKRQHQLHETGQISFASWSPDVSLRRKFRILFKKLGDVAASMDKLDNNPESKLIQEDMRSELIQVAAVCVSWLEGMVE